MNKNIKENYLKIRSSLPDNIEIVIAAKTRGAEEIKQVISAGARIIGENYIQEAERVKEELNDLACDVSWHMIGHLQVNKVKRAVRIFDMIETVDSLKLAREISERSRQISKIMPVLIEVNIAEEENKSGVLPEDCESLIKDISLLDNLKVMGLMTMGPLTIDAEIRPYFKRTKDIFEKLKKINLPKVEMKYLSMGMSSTYLAAVEEGGNVVRLGEAIFGEGG